MVARLTRQEIKRDRVREKLEAGILFFQRNFRRILLGMAGIFVLVIIGILISRWLEGRGQHADDLLADALTVYEAPIDASNPRPDDSDDPAFADDASRREKARVLFAEVQDKYSRSRAAAVADIYLGHIALGDGNVDEARERWEKFLDAQSESILALAVSVDLFQLRRDGGEAEALAAELSAELNDENRSLPEDLILYQLGKTLELLGRGDEAQEYYLRLSEEHPRSAFAAEVAQKLGPQALPVNR